MNTFQFCFNANLCRHDVQSKFYFLFLLCWFTRFFLLYDRLSFSLRWRSSGARQAAMVEWAVEDRHRTAAAATWAEVVHPTTVEAHTEAAIPSRCREKSTTVFATTTLRPLRTLSRPLLRWAHRQVSSTFSSDLPPVTSMQSNSTILPRAATRSHSRRMRLTTFVTRKYQLFIWKHL